MPKKVDNIIAEYAQSYDLQLEQPEGLPPLPGEPPIEGGGMPPVAPVAEPAPEPKTMTDESWVTAVKTMIELLSYGLHAEDDAIHREPIAKWLKMKEEINKENAWEVVQQIDTFLANED